MLEGRSKSAIRVMWVGTRRVRVWVWVRVRRIGGTGNGTADNGTRRDTGGNTAPTPVIAASAIIAATADVHVAVDVGGPATVDIGAVKVSAVDISPGGAGPRTTASGTATVDPTSGGTAVVTSAVGAPSGKTAATAVITTGTPAMTTATAKTTTSPAPPPPRPPPPPRRRHREPQAPMAHPCHPPSWRRYRGPCCRSRQRWRRALWWPSIRPKRSTK